MERLRTVPESEALKLIRQLRSAPSNSSAALDSAMNSLKSSTQLSDIRTNRSLSPPTQTSLEFELQVSHSPAYTPLEPLDLRSIDVSSWFLPGVSQPAPSRAVLPQGLSDTQPRRGRKCDSPTPMSETSQNQRHADGTSISPTRQWQVPVNGVVMHQDLSDDRLQSLEMSYWSTVAVENELAAAALTHFLLVHYPIFACFDASLFLDGLVDRKVDHCSPFLVSSVLSIACVCQCLSVRE